MYATLAVYLRSSPRMVISPSMLNFPALNLFSASAPPWASMAFLTMASAFSSAAATDAQTRAAVRHRNQWRMGDLQRDRPVGIGTAGRTSYPHCTARRPAGFRDVKNPARAKPLTSGRPCSARGEPVAPLAELGTGRYSGPSTA